MKNLPAPGTLIRAYEAGFHRVVNYDGGFLHYQRVLSASGKPIRPGKILVCSVAFLSEVTPEVAEKLLKEEEDALALKRKNLLALL